MPLATEQMDLKETRGDFGLGRAPPGVASGSQWTPLGPLVTASSACSGEGSKAPRLFKERRCVPQGLQLGQLDWKYWCQS